MITSIRIQNYRSFIDASVKLRPLSLVVGANGAGKTNFVRAVALFGEQIVPFETISNVWSSSLPWVNHINCRDKQGSVELKTAVDKDVIQAVGESSGRCQYYNLPERLRGRGFPIYCINSAKVSLPEAIAPDALIQFDGVGTAAVLERLKSGDNEALFVEIEERFKRYVPEVVKLSLRTVDIGTKQIQVRERGLEQPLPATELSEGTRIILCLLTIIHQENPPPIVLLEDIDRGLHPRLFEYLVPAMRDIAERSGINIIATTHNPYLVDCFQDDKEAVIIVEKKDGASTLTTLADKARDLDYDTVDPEDMPLGNLWFSGLVGGVPAKISRRLAKE